MNQCWVPKTRLRLSIRAAPFRSTQRKTIQLRWLVHCYCRIKKPAQLILSLKSRLTMRVTWQTWPRQSNKRSKISFNNRRYSKSSSSSSLVLSSRRNCHPPLMTRPLRYWPTTDIRWAMTLSCFRDLVLSQLWAMIISNKCSFAKTFGCSHMKSRQSRRAPSTTQKASKDSREKVRDKTNSFHPRVPCWKDWSRMQALLPGCPKRKCLANKLSSCWAKSRIVKSRWPMTISKRQLVISLSYWTWHSDQSCTTSRMAIANKSLQT